VGGLCGIIIFGLIFFLKWDKNDRHAKVRVRVRVRVRGAVRIRVRVSVLGYYMVS
jgi:hypothetical protein